MRSVPDRIRGDRTLQVPESICPIPPRDPARTTGGGVFQGPAAGPIERWIWRSSACGWFLTVSQTRTCLGLIGLPPQKDPQSTIPTDVGIYMVHMECLGFEGPVFFGFPKTWLGDFRMRTRSMLRTKPADQPSMARWFVVRFAAGLFGLPGSRKVTGPTRFGTKTDST